MMKYILIIVFAILAHHSKAQYEEDDDGVNTTKNFRADLRGSKIQYTPPRGYKVSYKSYSINLGNKRLTASRHQLTAIKDSIFVYFTISEIDTSKAFADRLKRYGFNDIIPNRNFLKMGHDTLKYRITHDAELTSLKKYYADQSGTYDLPLSIKYLNQYNYCKVMYIHKENRADIEIYFFYNAHSLSKLSKHIKNVSRRIKFLP